MLWSQSDLVKATAGDLIGDWRNDGIAGVSIDSRSIKSDELFVAVKAKRDGHNFINDAIRLGAKGALVDHIPAEIPRTLLCFWSHLYKKHLKTWASIEEKEAKQNWLL